jgi:decaprenylphospho-beta-D-ribofuranose 2-oxidase
MTTSIVSGWGRTAPARVERRSPTSVDELQAAFATKRPLIGRGLGRSYGDPAQVSGGLVLDTDELTAVHHFDTVSGIITAGAGLSLDDLLRVTMPAGWFVPVTPGTRQVTLAGAVAADVHGKNHHVDGSFGQHVLAMTLVSPTGVHEITPSSDPALFWATVGGMGLTGFITQVTVQLIAIETDKVLVDTRRLTSLDAVMAELKASDATHRYSVAWVDCMTTGRHMGRGIITRGVHAGRGDVNSPSLQGPSAATLTVPFDAPSGLLNPLSIKIFNEAWYRVAPAHRDREVQSIPTFFHPLDGVKDWNRLYGRRGFVQYQFAIPDAAGDTVVRAIDQLSSSKVPSFLAVLKRFGPGSPGFLSFPIAGWTLALDLPVGPAALPRVLDELDELILSVGGRIYLAKDARLDGRHLRQMYPRVDEFLAVKDRVDPEHLLTSDLARRLDLVRK